VADIVPSTTNQEQGGQREGKKSLPSTRLASLPPAELNAVLERAIEEYGRGVSVYAIANGLGVEHTTLYRQLIKHKEAEWRDAKESRALAELEEAEEEMKLARDPIALTRARERCRAAQWQLERLMRRIYGQEARADNAGRVSITLNIGAREPLDVVGGTVIDDVSKSHPSDRQE